MQNQSARLDFPCAWLRIFTFICTAVQDDAKVIIEWKRKMQVIHFVFNYFLKNLNTKKCKLRWETSSYDMYCGHVGWIMCELVQVCKCNFKAYQS